jgi:hypothetical protein
MNECLFEPTPDGQVKCSRCGHVKERRSRRRCNVQPFQLGDAVERLLRKAGITPERWQWYRDQLLGYVGIEPPQGCGCAKRKAWLNALGERLAALLPK